MLENTPTQPNSNPNEYDPVQVSLQYFQQQLAKHGIDVTPDQAFQLDVQQTIYYCERAAQRRLAEQGIYVSPEEAPKLSWQKYIDDYKLEIQQDLAAQGIDVSIDEAVAIDRLRFYHQVLPRLLERLDNIDRHAGNIALNSMQYPNFFSTA
jgi:hypothetical protein